MKPASKLPVAISVPLMSIPTIDHSTVALAVSFASYLIARLEVLEGLLAAR